MIDLKEYQNFANQGILPATKEREPIVAFALGLVGETGEVVDDIKKRIFHGRDVPMEHTEEELGDVMWYVANIATTLGLDLETIIKKNKEKLLKRYPNEYATVQEYNFKEGVRIFVPEFGRVTLIANGPHITMRNQADHSYIKNVSKEEANRYVREYEQRCKDSEPDLPWD